VIVWSIDEGVVEKMSGSLEEFLNTFGDQLANKKYEFAGPKDGFKEVEK